MIGDKLAILTQSVKNGGNATDLVPAVKDALLALTDAQHAPGADKLRDQILLKVEQWENGEDQGMVVYGIFCKVLRVLFKFKEFNNGLVLANINLGYQSAI